MIVAKMVDLDVICKYMVGMDRIPCNKMNFQQILYVEKDQ